MISSHYRILFRPVRSSWLLPFLIGLLLPLSGFSQAGRIYTQTDPASHGAISGHVSITLTHAIAIEHDHLRVFLGELSQAGHQFLFPHLPTGKYDLVLVAKGGVVYEGLALGTRPDLPESSHQNAEKRISLADAFFNQFRVHRMGASEGRETLLAFVERYRANDVLKQSGEALGQMVRRLEVIELTQADDDWQLTSTRHIYREGEPADAPHFLHSIYLSDLGNIRVITEPKELGEISISTSTE